MACWSSSVYGANYLTFLSFALVIPFLEVEICPCMITFLLCRWDVLRSEDATVTRPRVTRPRRWRPLVADSSSTTSPNLPAPLNVVIAAAHSQGWVFLESKTSFWFYLLQAKQFNSRATFCHIFCLFLFCSLLNAKSNVGQIPVLRPKQYKRLTHNKKTVSRAYGGAVCAGCVKKR